MKKFYQECVKRMRNLVADDQGFVMMSTLAIFLFLFVLCATIYAVGETIYQRIKIQNACDAAAYSAAVVQADGLSRMAVVNKAMAWNYVQMTNRQMDYITYRWLKLTCKRFEEDKTNAYNYAEQLIMAVDKEIGWWAILEGAASGALSVIFEKHCDTGGHAKEQEGRSWWCGLESGTAHEIDMNRKNSLANTFSLGAAAKEIADKYLANRVITYDRLTNVLGLVSFIDKTNDENNNDISHLPTSWGHYLGLLIDYDKKNIYRMNESLERVNTQMELSMKMTAENVLKAMLKDNRIDPDKVLQDYYISIHIPHGENPYKNQATNNLAPKSYFSPLHNTEADEMLFLNMQSKENAENNLTQQFPIFGGNGLAYGLDQWFIRGRGVYDKEYMKGEKEFEFYSLEEMSGLTLKGTERCEGTFGLQRVYKDTNLNEGQVGFLSKTPKTITTTEWKTGFSVHKKNFRSLPQCCQKASDGEIRNKYMTVEGHNHVITKNVIQDAKVVVGRGNHIFNIMDWAKAGFDAAKNFFGGSGSGDDVDQEADEEDSEGEVSVESVEDIAQQIQDLQGQNAQLQREISDLRSRRATATPEEQNQIDAEITAKEAQIAANNASIGQLQSAANYNAGNGGNVANSGSSTGAQQVQDGAGRVFSGMISSAIDSLIGDFLDIDPSCDNVHGEYTKIPMCEKAADTTALYSEYRWASCKYYCLTRLWTWSICMLFGKDVYCDRHKKTIAKVGFIKFKGRGHGHYGWPKWFCGASPTCPAEGFADWLLKYFPPFVGDISGDHGYMDEVYSFGEDGFLKPLIPLIKQKDMSYSRDEYESCTTFPDGTFRFATGSSSHAGLIRGHARIYADDKEIFDNRYVGAICKPWVLNERFFAGEGSVFVGAAMKHVNPFVQLFNFFNTKDNTTGTATQDGNERTVLSAFNIPKGNYMWTMSAARAGVRHRRRNGKFDQERQYQITYDSSSDAENLEYSNSAPYVLEKDGTTWSHPDNWNSGHADNNNKALTRIYFPTQEYMPVWNGCPCDGNADKFKNLWNLCETDWDATLLPVRYAGQRANLYLDREEDEDVKEEDAFNKQDYKTRKSLLADNLENVGDGSLWVWNPISNMSSVLMSNPFISSGWKRANTTFFENLLMSGFPGGVVTGWAEIVDGLNLNTKVPTGSVTNETQVIDVFTILKDKIL